MLRSEDFSEFEPKKEQFLFKSDPGLSEKLPKNETLHKDESPLLPIPPRKPEFDSQQGAAAHLGALPTPNRLVYQPRIYAPIAPIFDVRNLETPSFSDDNEPSFIQPPPPPPPISPVTNLAPLIPPNMPPTIYYGNNYPVSAVKTKRKSSAPIITFAVILTIIAGVLGGGIPAYRQITNYISAATNGYVPSVGTGASSPSVTSTDLSTAIFAAQQVLALASGKADTTDLEEKINNATKLVSNPKLSELELGKTQSELISSAENVKRLVKIVDVDAVSVEVQRKLDAGDFHSGATREDDVRNMLDTLGGSDIGIIYKDSPCDMDKASGCVSSEDPTVMYISPLILDPSYYKDYMLLQTVAHEYGHTVHFRTGYHRVFKDPDVARNFGEDPEHIADCMAQDIENFVFTTYGYTCSPEQLSTARKIWTGNLSS